MTGTARACGARARSSQPHLVARFEPAQDLGTRSPAYDPDRRPDGARASARWRAGRSSTNTASPSKTSAVSGTTSASSTVSVTMSASADMLRPEQSRLGIGHQHLDLEIGHVLLALAERRDVTHLAREDPARIRLGAEPRRLHRRRRARPRSRRPDPSGAAAPDRRSRGAGCRR